MWVRRKHRPRNRLGYRSARVRSVGPTFQNGNDLDTVTKGRGIDPNRDDGQGELTNTRRRPAKSDPNATRDPERPKSKVKPPSEISDGKPKLGGLPDSELFADDEARQADKEQRERRAKGVPPSPKAVAAKKAALLEKARSGDQGLLKALSTATMPRGCSEQLRR